MAFSTLAASIFQNNRKRQLLVFNKLWLDKPHVCLFLIIIIIIYFIFLTFVSGQRQYETIFLTSISPKQKIFLTSQETFQCRHNCSTSFR